MLREYIAHRLIGTALEKPARKLAALTRWPAAIMRRRSPEIEREAGRIDAAMKILVRPRMNCIDVGSRLGVSLARIIDRSPNGRHIAVEPQPRRAGWLRNKFPQVAIHATLLGDHTGHVERIRHGKRSSVPIEQLDLLTPPDRFIHFLRVSTGGQEIAVLRGASRLLRRCRPAILFQCIPACLHRHHTEPGELFELLKEFGYVVYLLKDFIAHTRALSSEQFLATLQPPIPAQHFIAVSRPRPRSRARR